MNVDPSGYFALAAMAGGSAQSANMQAVNSSVYINIYRSLALPLISSAELHFTKISIETLLITFVVCLGGSISTALLSSKVNQSLSSTLTSEEESIFNKLYCVEVALTHQIINATKVLSSYWEKVLPKHKHHIVAKKDKPAAEARDVLAKSNIDVNSDLNLVLINARTHAAIHYGKITKVYYDFVNFKVTTAYSIGNSANEKYLLVATALNEIRMMILAADKVIGGM